MPKFSDLVRGSADDVPVELRQLVVRNEPSMTRLFSDDYEEVKLHYENDDAVRGYVVCPGAGCPLCHLGNAPQLNYLFAVYNTETRAVEVLRVPSTLGPGSLLSQLKPVFGDPGLADKLVLISMVNRKSTLRTRPLPPNAERGDAVITAFMDRVKAGLTLGSAFVVLTAQELAKIDRIRTKLELMGDYVARDEGDVGASD